MTNATISTGKRGLEGRSSQMGSISRVLWKGYLRQTGLLLLLALLSATNGRATATVSLSTPTPVAAASMCPGTNQQVIYEFTLIATGLPPGATLTGISFTQSGTATSDDIIMYKLWSGAPGGTLVASSTTTSFTGLSTFFSGLLGTTVNYWITADIAPGATAGRTIVVDPMTTADFTTSSGFRTTFGTITGGGAQTVLLAPAAITGSSAVCVASTINLSNAVTGGAWTSSNTALATVDGASGVVSGVSDGSLNISYQLSTGCYTTFPLVVNPLPPLNTVTGGGAYCSGGSGVSVGLNGSMEGINYQLYYSSSITPVVPAGTGGPIDFGLQTGAGGYTVVATNATTLCSRHMAGSATVVVNPLPTQFTVTGGGAYCAGGSGFHIGLSGSELGVSYQLLRGETVVFPSMIGTGGPLDFGAFTIGGTYTVTATNIATGCVNNMSGSADIIVNPLPIPYVVFGGGSYCAGGAGVHVRLAWSQPGVIYVLYNGSATVGSPVSGTGLPLDFGPQTAAGTYTVVAIDATTFCSRNMYGSAAVSINPLPAVYTVTGGGSYCAGDVGLHIGLSSSDAGMMYMLYNGTTIMGSPLSGTGSALDFGLQTSSGVYTVVGVNSATTCMNNMSGASSITINPLPDVYTVTGGGNYCSGSAGVHVGLNSSATGINYQLYNAGAPVGSPVAGTGSTLDFGYQTLSGIYTAKAINSITACNINMAGSTSVIINPLPPMHNVTGGGLYCTHTGGTITVISPADAGGTEVHVGLDGSDEGMIYLLYNGTSTIGSPVAGTGGPIDFGVLYMSDTFAVEAIDATTLCTQNMNGNAVITIKPIVVPAVGINTGLGDTLCQGRMTTFHAIALYGGTTPAYTWKVNGTIVATGGSYSYVPANGDEVLVIMNSNADCAQPDTAVESAIINVIAPVTPSATIAVSPGTIVTTGQPVTFTANITNGGTAPLCQWYVNGHPVAGASSATYTTSALANNDSVSVTITRDDACAMSTFNSVIMNVVNVGVPQVASGNHNVTVMPNPSYGTFTVNGTLGNNDAEVSMDVVNVTGQVVYQKKVMAVNGKLNEKVMLANPAAGMYILNIRSASESTAIRIVVE